MKKYLLLFVCCLCTLSCSDDLDYENLLEEYLSTHSVPGQGYINIYVLDKNGSDMILNCPLTAKDSDRNMWHDKADIICASDLSIKYYMNGNKNPLPPYSSTMNQLLIDNKDLGQITATLPDGMEIEVSGKNYLRLPDPCGYILICNLDNTISHSFSVTLVCETLFGDKAPHEISYKRKPTITPYGHMLYEGYYYDVTFDGIPVNYCDGYNAVIVLR